MRGLTANTRVRALATAVRGAEWAKQKFPDTWETHFLTGTAVERISGRTWAVTWDYAELGTSNLASRFLLPEGSQAEAAAGAAAEVAGGRGRDNGRGRQQQRQADVDTNTLQNPSNCANDNQSDGELEEIGDGAFDPADDRAASAPGDDDLCPHGLQWADTGNVTEEIGAVPFRKATIKWADGIDNNRRDPIDYFRHTYPRHHVPEMLEATNPNLEAAGKKPTTEQEFFVLIGIMLTVALYSHFPVEMLFGVGQPTARFAFLALPVLSKFMTFTFTRSC